MANYFVKYTLILTLNTCYAKFKILYAIRLLVGGFTSVAVDRNK
jgi:hypothetical protein